VILIADDQVVNQTALSLILDKLGYPCILAEDGAEALEKAILHDVDLIFMDVQMPRMNGYEAAENLRKRGFKKPIITVTASEVPEERKNCLKAGINDVLTRPCKQSDIEKMLKKWLNAQPPAGPSVREEALQQTPGSTAQGSIAVFDAAEMLETFLNNVEVVLPLISRFIERTRTQLEKIQELEKTGDRENAWQLAHMISSAALTMGGGELGKAASRLELLYKNPGKDEIKTAFSLLQEAFDRYEKEAMSFIQSQS
jgi:CheY-like chemotaxis protein/HPt (histidine-containing phosphotransfer) domain-containing protein